MQYIYGWAALQYQAWACGSITVDAHATQDFASYSYTVGLIEHCIDKECSFGGDCITARGAPQIWHLASGTHQMDVRLVRDVRGFGSIGEPTVVGRIELKNLQDRVAAALEDLLVADIINGKVASPRALVPVRNHGSSAIDTSRCPFRSPS